MIDPAFSYPEAAQRQYREQGYYFFQNFLTAAALAQVQDAVAQLAANCHPESSPEEMISMHQRGADWLWELATQPQVLDYIEQQIGPDIVLWSTHMLCKPPRTGEAVPWHQDAPYWNITGRFPAAIWLPLDDVDEDNGTMSVLPGWHTRGTLPIVKRPASLFSEEIEPSVLPANTDELKVVYRLRAGQMAMHDVMIPHSSTPNRSDRWRRLLVMRYAAADAQFGNKTYRDCQTNEPFPRRFFLVRGRDLNNVGLELAP